MRKEVPFESLKIGDVIEVYHGVESHWLFKGRRTDDDCIAIVIGIEEDARKVRCIHGRIDVVLAQGLDDNKNAVLIDDEEANLLYLTN
jgi:hypothetical protein